jgi:hypothetical protein
MLKWSPLDGALTMLKDFDSNVSSCPVKAQSSVRLGQQQ